MSTLLSNLPASTARASPGNAPLSGSVPLCVGVLALQGDFDAHKAMLRQCGARVQVLEVRDAQALARVDGLLIPGGESTTMSRLCERYDLWQPLQETAGRGLPLFGTCAGMILMARGVQGGTRNFEQRSLGALDIDVARNAYGRQLDSFEAELDVPALQEADLGSEPLRALFIRAPRLERVGPGVQVLATHRGEPVAVRQGARLAAAFHPEIAGDDRLHRLWIAAILQHKAQSQAAAHPAQEAS